MEEWRNIHDAPGYEVSSEGRVRSIARTVVTSIGRTVRRRSVILAPTTNQYGHLKVAVRLSVGIRALRYVHAMVAEAFIGPRPAGMQIAHGDGNPKNCRPSNLRYATPLENSADMVLHGTKLAGESHPSAKLRAVDVIEIRDLLAGGVTQAELADRFMVTRGTISAIAIGRSWRSLLAPPAQGLEFVGLR